MWSFGILLWEIYSFGRVPYPRIVSTIYEKKVPFFKLKLFFISPPAAPGGRGEARRQRLQDGSAGGLPARDLRDDAPSVGPGTGEATHICGAKATARHLQAGNGPDVRGVSKFAATTKTKSPLFIDSYYREEHVGGRRAEQ